MLEKIIDLHIHSKYSRSCSKELELPKIAKACEQKGIDIVSTSDFTHPQWFEHIKDHLVEDNKGIYKLKDNSSPTRFILGTEVSCIYKDKDKCRRLHLLLFAPNIDVVEKFNNELTKRGVNIKSDGRPIMGLTAKEILKIMLDIDKDFFMIPAHAWTPWFAIFGSKSGYDSLEECFEELTPHIKAIETGLSSDPPMNHTLKMLDNITLVSNSDAHSLYNLGREANVFVFQDNKEITFKNIKEIIETGDKKRFLHTIEFYPEEGKYHCDGHRDCKVCLEPKQSKKEKGLCPKCKKKLTIGVLNRVDELSDRDINNIKEKKYIPHKYIVPLREVISAVVGVGPRSKRVEKEYEQMTKTIGNEFYILIKANKAEILKNTNEKNIWIAIKNMREGKVKIVPGYDGEFGIIKTFDSKKMKQRQKSLL